MLGTFSVLMRTMDNMSESFLPFSQNSLGFAGGKLLALSVDLFFEIKLFQVAFLNFFYPFFSLLSTGLVVIAVGDYFSPGNWLGIRGIINW